MALPFREANLQPTGTDGAFVLGINSKEEEEEEVREEDNFEQFR